MAFISITRLRLRSAWQLPRFIWLTIPAASQARKAEGNLGMDALRDANLAFWTKSAWRDEAAMRAFMLSGAHRKAMPVLKDMCDEASGVHWEQESSSLPSWQEAHRRLQEGGRRVHVLTPTANHLAGRSDPPKAQ
jgi:quinol monooxygenase YgiN